MNENETNGSVTTKGPDSERVTISEEITSQETSPRKRLKIQPEWLITETMTIRDEAFLHPNLKDFKLGVPGQGFSKANFDNLEKFLVEIETPYERVHLNALLPAHRREEADFAEIFIIPHGVNIAAKDPQAADAIFKYLLTLEHDSKVVSYQKVCNRLAQQTLILVNGGSEHPAENGIGNVHDFLKVPHMETVRKSLATWTGMAAVANNVAECNQYKNTVSKRNQCGVGFHGDAESTNVCALRFGVTFPFSYQWFQNSLPVGHRFCKDLDHGTLYLMSQKAVGKDWKKRSILTLRHCAGRGKYALSNEEIIDKKTKRCKK
jgi:hypothetical protein